MLSGYYGEKGTRAGRRTDEEHKKTYGLQRMETIGIAHSHFLIGVGRFVFFTLLIQVVDECSEAVHAS